MGLKQTIIKLMKEEAYKPMDIQELAINFHINKDDYKFFKKTLRTMEKEGLIVRDNKNRYEIGRASCRERV